MKIAIVGSRDYPRLKKVREFVASLPQETIVISGGARGVDMIAWEAADERHMATQTFRPDWDKHGKSAGFIRNQQIVDACDEVVAFWDGESNGTRDTISKAKAAGKKVTIIRPEP